MIIALDEWYRSVLGGRLGDHELRFYNPNTIDRAAFVELICDVHALSVRRPPDFRFGRDLIAALPAIQFAHKTGAGVDWFDLDAATEAGILIAANSGFNAAPVAEHSLMLMLLTLRQSFKQIAALREGVWRREPTGAGPMQLAGKTVGIVGLGEIGGRLAKAVLALGASVIAYQRSPLPEWAAAAGVEAVTLDDLMRRADIVSLNTPLTPETDGLISRERIALMKPTAILINTARGKVVDERALYEALRDGRIHGAGLDVFNPEPPAPDNPLLALPNVVATPHVGGAVVEMAAIQAEGTLDNLERFAAGLLPLRIQNPEALTSNRLRATHLVNGARG